MDPGKQNLDRLDQQPNLVNEGPETQTPKNTNYGDVSSEDAKKRIQENLSANSSIGHQDFSPIEPQKGSIEDFRVTDWDAVPRKAEELRKKD
ncbi:hypothetical protein G6F43_000614 [Rhizopus delemar]|nr:hypothetical protein G6F43_000614 [Rhizopus delemar]